MKYLYVLASLFVLTACATDGPKYSGNNRYIDPIVQSNRNVTYMSTNVNDLAKATEYCVSRNVTGLDISTEKNKHFIAENNAKRIKTLFYNLYKLSNSDSSETIEIETKDVIDIYKIVAQNIESCTEENCTIKTDQGQLLVLNETQIQEILKNGSYNDIISKFFDISTFTNLDSVAFNSQNLSNIEFSIETTSDDDVFTYTFDDLTKNKINQIKLGPNGTPLDRDNDDNATFGNKAIEVVSLAKNIKTMNKVQTNTGLAYADFGFINKKLETYGIYFGDYETKRTQPSETTKFKTIDTTTNRFVYVENPEFSGKAALLIKDGEKSPVFQEGNAKLAYTKNNGSVLKITNDNYVVQAKSSNNQEFDTIKFEKTPQGSVFETNSNKTITGSPLYYYSNDGKNISEAAGKINYTQDNTNNYYKATFGVVIDNK